MEVARRNGSSRPEVTVEDHIQRWRRIEGEVEDRLWKLAEIAHSVVGLEQYGSQTVPRFAEAVGHQAHRIYQLSSAWRLRTEMFGRGEMLSRANGKPLTVSHFVLARGEDSPEQVIDECIALSLSTADLEARAKERRQEQGRKAIRETVGASDSSNSSTHIVRRSDADGTHLHPGYEDTCAACGGFLMQMTRLGAVAEDLGMGVSAISGESGVSEDLVERMVRGEWVNQQMGMRVAEAMRKKITERERGR